MEIAKGVTLDFVGGEVVLKAQGTGFELLAKGQVAGLAVPVLNEIKAKVESGEIDPIKGTDLDKTTLLGALDFLIETVSA